MRKLFLISAFALVSLSAQAGEVRDVILAANDAPVAAAAPAPAVAPAPAPATSAPKAVVAEPVQQTAVRRQPPSISAASIQRASSEQKARRIAARYGISW